MKPHMINAALDVKLTDLLLVTGLATSFPQSQRVQLTSLFKTITFKDVSCFAFIAHWFSSLCVFIALSLVSPPCLPTCSPAFPTSFQHFVLHVSFLGHFVSLICCWIGLSTTVFFSTSLHLTSVSFFKDFICSSRLCVGPNLN